MKIVGRPNFEYQIYERDNGSKFIKVLLYINDADGYVEVGRINKIKSHWTNNGYGDLEDVYSELKENANLADFIAKTNPTVMSK